VIWNPWQEAIADFSDLDKENFRDFICIETANAANDKVILEAGQSHTITAIYKLLGA
jgi:glucose-6-phosphate 1-epimerase